MHHVKTAILSMLCWLVILPLSAAQAQTYTVLHAFTGHQDGANPLAGLILDGAGNLYGTTYGGGNMMLDTCNSAGCGIVFKMTRRNSAWVLTPLNTFNLYNGAGSLGPVLFGPDSLLYGSTSGGGNGNCFQGPFEGCGVVYSLQPPATACHTTVCSWTENLIYQFATLEDGFYPGGNLVFDQAGNLYGTTEYGGTGGCFGDGCGTVFELTRSGSGWVKTTIGDYNNGGPEGLFSGLIIDRAGNLYGSSDEGGSANYGTVYELTRSGSGWTTTIIHSFTSVGTGAYADGGLVMDQAGNLYGTTDGGGASNGGIVFELSPSNGGWNYSVIWNLAGPGSGPTGSLAMDAAGNLYGTTYGGGAFQCGNVFKLAPSGGQWSFTDLYDFTCGNDGGHPQAGVTLDANGNLYGTTYQYGPNGNCLGVGCGVVWEITP